MIAKIVFITSYFIKENPGSTEAQISILTGKVARLTSHLKIHNKDFSSQRGLRKILGKRKRLLAYLYRQDPMKYDNVITELGIRGAKKYITA
jgi:small subunit ribosomal protein S15